VPITSVPGEDGVRPPGRYPCNLLPALGAGTSAK
jgi:hypothetical protein